MWIWKRREWGAYSDGFASGALVVDDRERRRDAAADEQEEGECERLGCEKRRIGLHGWAVMRSVAAQGEGGELGGDGVEVAIALLRSCEATHASKCNSVRFGTQLSLPGGVSVLQPP